MSNKSKKSRSIITGLMVISLGLFYLTGKACTARWKELAEHQRRAETEQALSQEAVAEIINSTLLPNLCRQESLLIECFHLKPEICLASMKSAMTDCLASEWPSSTKRIAMSMVSKLMGQVSSCSMSKIFHHYGENLKQTAECINPTPSRFMKGMYGGK